jgi:hypothetical protein
MNKFVLLCLLFTLTSFTTTSNVPDLQNLNDCFNKQAIKDLTGLVYDLYMNKLTFSNFIQAFIKANSNFPETLKCIQTYGGDQWKLQKDSHVLLKIGYTLVYGTSCQGDIGQLMIYLDRILEGAHDIPKNWKSLIANAVFTGVTGYQVFHDCKLAYKVIRDTWWSDK